MTIVVRDYEGGSIYTMYKDNVKEFGMSRIMFEIFIKDILNQNLVTLDGDGDFQITEEGKYYAIEHTLIDT